MTKYYTREHEWLTASDTNGIWRVGITDYAQDQLGDVVSAELPEIGSELSAGETCAVVESVKSASDIYVPFAGTIVAVNERLVEEPELINQSPENDGWLFDIQLEGQEDCTGFLDEQQYAELTAE